MISIFRKNKSTNFHASVPFSASGTEDGLSFTNGEVLSIGGGETFSLSGGGDSIKINDEVAAAESDRVESYLHIKGYPAASTIEEVNILNEKEVEKKRENSDDSLNIYLPLTLSSEKLGEAFEVEIANNLNTNFLWLKSNEEKPFACFFDSDKIFVTGYLLQSGNERRIREREEVGGISEGGVLILDVEIEIEETEPLASGFSEEPFNGVIKEEGSDPIIRSISLNKYKLRAGTKETAKVSYHEVKAQTEEPHSNVVGYFGGGGENPLHFSGKLQIRYPLGFVEDNNFIHGREPSNITVQAERTKNAYFVEEGVSFVCPAEFDDEGEVIRDVEVIPENLYEEVRTFFITVD